MFNYADTGCRTQGELTSHRARRQLEICITGQRCNKNHVCLEVTWSYLKQILYDAEVIMPVEGTSNLIFSKAKGWGKYHDVAWDPLAGIYNNITIQLLLNPANTYHCCFVPCTYHMMVNICAVLLTEVYRII